MRTVYFRDYQTSGDTGYDLYALFCSLQGEKDIKVIFDPGEYDVWPDMCFQRNLCISNHGFNGPKRIAVLLENMQDVELDFSGSVLRTHGIMTAFSILNSSKITIKNVILENPATQVMQMKVIAHGDDYVDFMKMQGCEQFRVRKGEFVTDYTNGIFYPIWMYLEYSGQTGHLLDERVCFDGFGGYVEELGDDVIRWHNFETQPAVGNVIIFNATRRLGVGIFCEDSEDILCENVTVHSCYGMGFSAQTCHNITLRGFNTKKSGERFYSANADATHFISCTGLVTVEDCLFENQLDDALNIHGMYTRIARKTKTELFVTEVQEEAKGIKIFNAGDRIQILNPQTLIPYAEKTIKEVTYINADTIRLELCESTEDICAGDTVENISRAADLVFRRNVLRNNRARGILLASRGKTLIEDCLFQNPGPSIQFEANGDYWYESGGTLDVTIRANVFDRSQNSFEIPIINAVPRQNVLEGQYFHKEIRVIENEFRAGGDTVVHFDNIEHAVFKDNRIICKKDGDKPVITYHHIGKPEIETDISVQEITK